MNGLWGSVGQWNIGREHQPFTRLSHSKLLLEKSLNYLGAYLHMWRIPAIVA